MILMKPQLQLLRPFVIACTGLVPLLLPGRLDAADWPQWRGPQRDGISRETGLLKEWPKEGPRLLWQKNDSGAGYSTPAVMGDRICLLSNEGLDNEFVQALDVKDGGRLWQTRLGKVGNPDQKPSYPGARSTPTVDGDILFALGSDGDLACIGTADGKVRWQRHLRAEFGGRPGVWAYSESPLLDGDALVCTPGGSNATMIALNKRSGELLWKCAVPGGDEAAYASPILVEVAGVRQYVQLLGNGLVGVEAKTGRFLWRYDKAVSIYRANIPTPLAHENLIYTAGAGKGGGLVRLKVNAGQVEAEQVYFSPKLPTAIGGVIKIGESLYGTTGQAMLCVDFATGNVRWEERALGAASFVFADGRLYLHAENGDAGLVEPSPEGYREKGRFTPPNRPKRANDMEKAWTFPVVANGRLYLRDHAMLWCYDVKAP